MKTPERCLICGAEWKGGSKRPGEAMCVVSGLVDIVFYECGARSFLRPETDEANGVYVLVTRGCGTEANEDHKFVEPEEGHGKWYVCWTDANAYTEWADQIVEPSTIESVGFLIFESPEYIVLAQSIDHNEKFDAQLAIPRSLILSMFVI